VLSLPFMQVVSPAPPLPAGPLQVAPAFSRIALDPFSVCQAVRVMPANGRKCSGLIPDAVGEMAWSPALLDACLA